MAARSGAAELPGIDVILPIGKPGAPAGHAIPELSHFNGRTLIEWAVEEAVHAGAARILMVAPEGDAAAAVVARHLRRTVAARRGDPRGRQPQLVLVRRPETGGNDGDAGWDGLVRRAARQARGAQALLIDPVVLLTAGTRITTFASFMLRRAALEHRPDCPLLATADLPWEEALSLPVLAGDPARPALCLDRPAASATLTVFAGRALIPLPLPPAPPMAEPEALFPAEALVGTLLSAGGQSLRLLFHPLDLRFSPLADAPLAPRPAGLPFTARLGLSALRRVG